ncbi:hypothetical protein AXX17_AT1G43210 [Arabidopsis thaliana]|uniref:Uncharacterized protein n=1 Tax=Arabidopsis thaliana TaxID=3702 RepID=A0A178WDP5_ARATH|nr:hypothetical protein AXX17_AT1G43210 [Arabidopsis thaliana]
MPFRAGYSGELALLAELAGLDEQTSLDELTCVDELTCIAALTCLVLSPESVISIRFILRIIIRSIIYEESALIYREQMSGGCDDVVVVVVKIWISSISCKRQRRLFLG